ncbi:MAG: dicarboxylate/amino acid:cation symporter [Bacteroidetes bacterium]|nr:dicarboxylate/amino acid:cation symporter [Bacteroidota bacterium]MBL0066276.1 dicarboxylate/amino acid:cation symporter [Bacteroidota bacterium]MBL0139071.1 dicarboxylate/amino acid:cation symporter [Bacteroidota bacterium]
MRKITLTGQIIIGLLLGIALGAWYRHNWPDPENIKPFAENMQVLSDIFLRLIKMIIAPLVFSLLLTGIAKVGDFKTVGRIGLKTLIYFTGATLIALVLGLIIVNIFEPGTALLQPDAHSLVPVQPKPFEAREFVSHIFPESIADAMSRNQILPIIIFVLFFGMATASLHEKGKIVIDFFDSIAHIMLKVTSYVMKIAPLAVFGAMTAVIASKGLDVLGGYVKIILCFFGGLIFFVFVILLGICALFKINFFRLLEHVKEPMLLAFSTASSEAAMPKTILGLERFGCPDKIISFVLPLGYSFNLDGSIMYMTFATMSIAQAYGMHLSVAQQITMMLILLVTSKGMAGVPRASLVVIAGMLQTFNIPQEGLTLLLAIDWLLDMGRSATNVMGNAVATAVVSKWEGAD